MKKILFIGLLSLFSIAVNAQEKYTEHDSEGRLRVMGYIDKKTGKKVGHWVTYGSNGKKSSEVNYNNGERDGKYYEYNLDGGIYLVKTYSNGLLNGPCVEYYDFLNRKGVLPIHSRSFYVNGQQEGMEYIYESDGKILFRRRYEAGVMLTDTAYNYDGIYITTLRTITDPTEYNGYRRKYVKEFFPYKKQTSVVKNSRPAPKRKQVQPKRTQTQAAPKPQERKKPQLKVGNGGVIEYE